VSEVARVLESAAGGSSAAAPVVPASTGPLRTRDALVASARQKALLDRAAVCLDAALSGLRSGAFLDEISPGLDEAADALGEMTGEIASEEVLEAIFSRFCLGK
jgi:tRNA U34 5-carboxymethylaminomethyl modifying GTPase MnmE/TrmE